MAYNGKPRRPRTPKKLDADELWDYALRALAGRPHSTAELRMKLARRAASPELLAPALEKLRDYGLVDDQKFSQTFATARLENQGFGKTRVLRDLRAKRVASKIAEEAVTTVFSTTDEMKLTEQFLLRRYRGKNLPEFLSEEKNLAAAYRRLRTAGFSHTSSLTVLKRHRSDMPEWDAEDDETDLDASGVS